MSHSPEENSTEEKQSREQENPHWELPSELRKKLEDGLIMARKEGVVPDCNKGHGKLDLNVSRKGTLYWRCLFPTCEERAWYKTLTTHLCPLCQKKMEKVPSRKVTGGYFLKCDERKLHSSKEDVVLFKDRVTNQWNGAVRQPIEREIQKERQLEKDLADSVLALIEEMSKNRADGARREETYSELKSKIFMEEPTEKLELFMEKLIQEGYAKYLPSKDVFVVIRNKYG